MKLTFKNAFYRFDSVDQSPLWSRKPDGQIAPTKTVPIKPLDLTPLETFLTDKEKERYKWCIENCKDITLLEESEIGMCSVTLRVGYYVHHTIQFNNEKDYTWYRLRWE